MSCSWSGVRRWLAVVAVALVSCSSVDVVRLQPDMVEVPEGMEPVAGLQTTCLGFYLFTLGIPAADLEKAVNELLMKEARKIGADRVMNLQFDATPEGGIWWLTKLLGFRSASASGVAIRKEAGFEGGEGAPPPPVILPPAAEGGEAGVPLEKVPATRPSSGD
jgi:hypothetical protein